MDRIRMLAILACSGVALAAGSAVAQDVKVVKIGAALDAKRVVKDKDTGQLRAATPEEIEAMGAARTRITPSIIRLNRPETILVDHADGSSTIKRSVEDLDALRATRGADGKLVIRHGAKE